MHPKCHLSISLFDINKSIFLNFAVCVTVFLSAKGETTVLHYIQKLKQSCNVKA